MKLSIDTKEDSHDEIRKVINMLQNIVGDSQQVFSNQPMPSDSSSSSSPFGNIFGDAFAQPSVSVQDSADYSTTPEPAEEAAPSQSTGDLFAELFSEEELKKMDATKVKDEEEDEEEEIPKSKDKKFDIELY